MGAGQDELIHQQYDELVQKYSDLDLCKDESSQWVVAGNLSFSASFEGKETIDDSFSIQIVIPNDYPDTPPTAFEVGSRIPREADFHINESGEMCLAASVEVRKKFSENPSLLQFVEELVIPFLYGFSYRERNGEWPWGELSHGHKGIREYYQELFKTDDFRVVLRLLKLLADGSYRGHLPCPCGSGVIQRRCHGEKLRALIRAQSPEQFFIDAGHVFDALSKEERKQLSIRELPKLVIKDIKKEARNRSG